MNEELERAAKALPLLVAGLYVVGFIVVGVYLSGYGVSSLELLRIQYLAAGFWCGFPLLFFYLATALFQNVFVFDSRRSPGPIRRALVREALSFAALLSILLLIGFVKLAVRSSGSFATGIIVAALHLRVSALIGLIVCMLGADLCRVARGVLQDKDLKRAAGATGGAFLVAWVMLFSRNVYPVIPFSLGGGQPRDVVFILNEPAQQSPATSFLARDGQGSQTVAYKLLLENEGSFVVISPKDGQKAIEFDRKAVAAVIVLGKWPKSADNLSNSR